VGERIAEPSRQVLDKKLSLLGITGYVGEMFTSGSVCGYLKEVKKKREKERLLRPKVMDIVRSELCSLSWGDDCLKEYVEKMFMGADLTQVELFYDKYMRSGKRRTSFFLYFISYEL
jgi:hypothetical protein